MKFSLESHHQETHFTTTFIARSDFFLEQQSRNNYFLNLFLQSNLPSKSKYAAKTFYIQKKNEIDSANTNLYKSWGSSTLSKSPRRFASSNLKIFNNFYQRSFFCRKPTSGMLIEWTAIRQSENRGKFFSRRFVQICLDYVLFLYIRTRLIFKELLRN